jgi:4-aminobutyrate aminotransferase-like enzyme/Ser/Thr protein kinase RdoA (MazF antagonist)
MNSSSSSDETSVLEAKAPAFSPSEAEEIAHRVFGVVASAHPLDSERDQNFRLSPEAGPGWVLKIANPAEDPAVLDFQTKALLHIARVDPDLAVPQIKTTLNGDDCDSIEGPDGRLFIVRALSFLPGALLNDVATSPALRRDVGAAAARLARALRGFFHPAAGHELLWDIMQASDLRQRTHYIEDPTRRSLIEKGLDHLEAVVLPQLRTLRAQVIHNDVSAKNTLVGDERVTGSIDFGDLIHAPLVCDLAVPISELILQTDDPLSAAAEITAGYHAVTALSDDELRLIFDIVCARCMMGIAIASWRVADHPENSDYILDGTEESWDLLQFLQDAGPDRVHARLRRSCGGAGFSQAAVVPNATLEADEEDLQPLMEHRRQRLGPGLELSYDRPLHLVRGEGVWLIDASGRPFLDAYNNVPHVGHCHPAVVDALAQQAATLNTNTRYLYDSLVEYSDRLVATMPGDLSVCMFVCSGSEANDLAWRLAKAHTGNAGGITIEDAYHGTTDAVFELSPAEHGKRRPIAEHVATVPAPDGYRGRFRRDDPRYSDQYADRYSSCLDDAISALGDRGFAPAAFYLDLILSSSGVLVPPPGYLSAAFEKVRAAGGLCVADEVQSGFGRTGDHFWGFEAHGVVPDIVSLGKPIGNGYSMAAVVTTPAIVRSLIDQSEFFSTTGGNPVACKVGLAVLDVMEREELQANAARVGGLLRARLSALADEHALIGDVRGAGLFIGVELVRHRTTLEPATTETDAVVNRMRDAGVLVGIDGPNANVIKIRPPLVFDETHAEQLTDALDAALRAI